MAGYQVDQACYSSVQGAVEAIAARVTGSTVQVGTNPYRVDATFVAPSSIQYQGTQMNGGTGTFSKTIAITPEPSNALDLDDGVQLAWLVVAVWAAAFAMIVLRKAVFK